MAIPANEGEADFVKQLRDEKLRTQEARTNYTVQKLIYATALLGVGSLSISLGLGPNALNFNLIPVLYLVPAVALVFDFYILGEDYSVKRLGMFLGRRSPAGLEQGWETWVADNRDPFAPWAMPILTTLLTIGAGLLIWRSSFGGGVFYWPLVLWATASLMACWGLFLWYRHLRQRTRQRAEVAFGKRVPIPDEIARLRNTTASAAHLLVPAVFDGVRDLFLVSRSGSRLHGTVTQLAPEYGSKEFMPCVNGSGAQVATTQQILNAYRKMVDTYSDFALWFQEASTRDGQPVLLAARWLCHLIGIRHPTVELFIEHPTLADHTLVQVRALDKFEAPGCFDLPAAGHVVGLDTAFGTLLKEMYEELNLEQSDILELEQVGGYPCDEQRSEGYLCNSEYRTVYRGCLADGSWSKLRFTDDEVAGIALFNLPALQEMRTKHPDRLASALANYLTRYVNAAPNNKA